MTRYFRNEMTGEIGCEQYFFGDFMVDYAEYEEEHNLCLIEVEWNGFGWVEKVS